jgi:hypothetical protein
MTYNGIIFIPSLTTIDRLKFMIMTFVFELGTDGRTDTVGCLCASQKCVMILVNPTNSTHTNSPRFQIVMKQHRLWWCDASRRHGVMTGTAPTRHLSGLSDVSNDLKGSNRGMELTICTIRQSMKVRWTGHVACMGQIWNAQEILVGKPKTKRQLGRPRRRWNKNININRKEIGWEHVDWIPFFQDGTQWTRNHIRTWSGPISVPINVTMSLIRATFGLLRGTNQSLKVRRSGDTASWLDTHTHTHTHTHTLI